MQTKFSAVERRVKIKGHKQGEESEYGVWDKALFFLLLNNPENIGYHVITSWLASGEIASSGTILVQSVSLATFYSGLKF